MNDTTKTNLLVKVASADKAITVINSFLAMRKKAVDEADKPIEVVGTAAETTPVATEQPTAIKPTYTDFLKRKAGETWDWTKGQWNKLSPEAQNSIKGIGAGVTGALALNSLAGLIPGVKKNTLLRAMALIGGGIGGLGLNNYLSNPENRKAIAANYTAFKNSLKG
jgi:hypothetical protein